MLIKKNHKFILSFKYAFRGIYFTLRTQLNAKIHIFVALIVIFLGFLLKISNIEWCIILICIGIVLSAEIMNTAIEQIVDLVSPEYNKLAGNAKDAAAGAVLILAICSVIIGIIIFLPKIKILIFS